MKIVHLMQDEKFTDGIVGFYNEFFNNGEHEIIYFSRNKGKTCIRRQFSIKQTDFNINEYKGSVASYLNKLKCDYIVLHSLFFTTKEKIELLLNKSLMKKVVWIEWGADLYSWKQESSFTGKIKNAANYKLRESFENIVCIFPPDIDYFKNQFPDSNSNIYYAPYNGFPVDKEFSTYKNESRLNPHFKSIEPVYIQIGQNSLTTLNHIRVLKNLSKFKDENIRIILPLSYGGTKEYADEVVDYAEREFPGKVIALRKFMPKEEYFKLIEKVEIAIFDTDRQCALGNIERLFFRNVNVYLSENGVMYKYFADLGVPVKKCEDIKSESFKNFIAPPTIENRDGFMKYIKSLSSIDSTIERWNYIFENLRHVINEK